MSLDLIQTNLCCEGEQRRYRHRSGVLNCDMVFSLFLPPQAVQGPVPLLTWLSGLTCTDENFVTKAGAQKAAAVAGVAILAPDTSPRGDDVPDDPEGAYDFGHGAGFYLNATQDPWAEHYHMYDYIVEELPTVLGSSDLPLDMKRQSIFGHSMGGHGALTIGLKNQDRFRSISAFAPIVNPMAVPWGEKAFHHYLGADREAWADYDACQLLQRLGTSIPVLIDQGEGDDFLDGQLQPWVFEEIAKASNLPVTVNMRPGYDHSYFFMASFIDDHIRFHAGHLA